MDETKFDRNYVPQHLAEKVRDWRDLSFSDRINLTGELSNAAWAEIGVVFDPNKPMDKTIQHVSHTRRIDGHRVPQVSRLRPGIPQNATTAAVTAGRRLPLAPPAE